MRFTILVAVCGLIFAAGCSQSDEKSASSEQGVYAGAIDTAKETADAVSEREKEPE